MEVIGPDSFKPYQLPPEVHPVVALGVFDGIHLGHRKVIRRAVEAARAAGCPSAVFSFCNHPAEIVRPDDAPARLTSLPRRLEIFESLSVDYAFVPLFTREFSQLPPEEFARRILVERLHASAAVVGENYRFGHQRRGDVTLLRELGADHGFRIEVVEPYLIDGEPVSSTRVRRALSEGKVEEAWTMLGRPFEISGTIIEGERRGRTLGIPTINLKAGERTPIADGVYSAITHLPDRVPVTGIGYVGRKPTFSGEAERLLEVNLFDFEDDVYGVEARVELHTRIRGSVRFNGPEALVRQIREDQKVAREYFAEREAASRTGKSA